MSKNFYGKRIEYKKVGRLNTKSINKKTFKKIILENDIFAEHNSRINRRMVIRRPWKLIGTFIDWIKTKKNKHDSRKQDLQDMQRKRS